MKLRKSHFRACARVALERHGFSVDIKHGAGIIHGARLRAIKDGQQYEVAVRTSLDREIGLTREPDGRWRTIPRMDFVLVAVPSADVPDCAEILCFRPSVLIEAFDRALSQHKQTKPAFSHKAPVFVVLDRLGDLRVSGSGLKNKAEWIELIPLGSVPVIGVTPSDTSNRFVERVKREFAQLIGVDVSKVEVTFRIVA